MIDCTILLPNYNNENALPIMFDRLRQNIDCSRIALVMVDDGSTDKSLTVAKNCLNKIKFADVTIIENRHTGVVDALNSGLDAIKTDVIIRIDGDATVETPGWANRICEWLKRYPEVGAVGAQILFDDGRIHSFGRNVVGPLGLYDLGCAPTEAVGNRTFDSLVLRPVVSFTDGIPYEVDSVLGVCVGFRKSEAEAVGGFDSKFNPVWIEDDDFGLSIRGLNRRIIVDPSIHVNHRTSLRGSRNPSVSNHEAWKNHYRFTLRGVMRQYLPRRLKAAYRAFLNPCPSSPSLPLPQETDPWRKKILNQHYMTWEKKWGFNPLNPNLIDIYEKYWDTAICWRLNPKKSIDSVRFLQSSLI